ncbi:hypothetical protein FOXG_17308 [Fusarium oxysporum f. sp. lycopersici 4287]|uniref:Arrestin-like N-terminal domain-containing protein n=1 Tax=Fusarium oxysporum f. sp. lycopersici (strain 4287 / CBS 123668 / FGSC 9935 / NRRL 34936) TaxID=426428 RepID=A0A0J9WA58_FUSO4|nr:hypothetical protein FOXG_17308 [Fusarium oxysporum f. sp. lycopersici 4287]KNB20229.1 hypothetical protein FOXG_17308 [Fusarium oxysporum f. sp. lycopersici 4287]
MPTATQYLRPWDTQSKMPRTVSKGTPFLEILLDGEQRTYQAGNTITGRVVRNAPVVAARAWLAIQVHGRSKSKKTVSRGKAGTSIYRGRFNFFGPDQNRQQLFDGPIHIPPGGAVKEWPFAVTVPSRLDPSTVATGNEQKYSYLPLGPQDVATHSMPPVFYASGIWMATTYQCYVEYFLEAQLHVEAAAGPTNIDTATLPVNITPPSTPDMITDFDLSRHSFLCRLSTHRFIPGLETAGLSLQQRTQKFFGSSKVPQFAFSLQIKASTEMICPGTLRSHTADETRRVGFELESAIAQLGAPIVLPSGEKAEPLDIGALLQLRITSATPLGHRPFSSYTGQLYPSFETYNIKHSHRLKWDLTVTAGGESTELSNEVDITLLPLSGLPASDTIDGGDWPIGKEHYEEHGNMGIED